MRKLLKQTFSNSSSQWYNIFLAEIKVVYNCASGQELVLFNNKEILIGNQTSFYKEWFQKGIFLIQHLLQENGQFLTFPKFIQQYEVDCSFLNYI